MRPRSSRDSVASLGRSARARIGRVRKSRGDRPRDRRRPWHRRHARRYGGGSIITAAQSGARWGYRLFLLQILLIPVLFVVQELAVRLGIITGKGHGELIRDHFGPRWAWLSVSALLVACAGALVTEFVGVQAVGRMLGVPSWASLGLAAGFLLVVVGTGSYRRVEIVALLLGACELAFIVLAVRAHPDEHSVASGLCASAGR